MGDAAVAAAGRVHGFVPALTSFVGRESEVGKVAGLLGEYRLVTVTGPGGVGKTRLAGEVARRVASRFADGVWLVELAAVQEPALVPAAVAVALEVHQPPGMSLVEALVEALARQQLLLMLDNCEHMLAAVAELCGTLLTAADDVRVLATSREPVGIAGEARYRLSPLAVPGPDHLVDFGASDAMVLFADRARQLDSAFALTGDSPALVAQIVGRLDGMPLAIELAAARAEALGLPQLLERLDHRFALLTGVTGERRRGSGHWRRPWSGATSCSVWTSGGCSAGSRSSQARSLWTLRRRSPGASPSRRCCTWSTARCSPRPVLGPTAGPGI